MKRNGGFSFVFVATGNNNYFHIFSAELQVGTKHFVSFLGEKVITRPKLGNGTVCASGATNRYVLDIQEDPENDEILLITYYPEIEE